MNRLLQTFDDWARATRVDGVDRPHRFDSTRVPSTQSLDIDLCRSDIGTIIWATGYRPDYSWLHVPVLDRKGRIRHDGGVVTDAPGMYLLGTNVLRRRRSSFIHGAQPDTEELSAHLHGFLDGHRNGSSRSASVGDGAFMFHQGEMGGPTRRSLDEPSYSPGPGGQ